MIPYQFLDEHIDAQKLCYGNTLEKNHLHNTKPEKPTRLTKKFGFSSIHLPSEKSPGTLLLDFAPLTAKCSRFWLTSQYLREKGALKKKRDGRLDEIYSTKNLVVIW